LYLLISRFWIRVPSTPVDLKTRVTQQVSARRQVAPKKQVVSNSTQVQFKIYNPDCPDSAWLITDYTK